MTTIPPSFAPGRLTPVSRPGAMGGPGDAMWRGYLDIQLRDGPVKRRVLLEKHLFIGRTNQVQLVLDHETVSRQHAELFCDPFGRWWIRDLNSTNGTMVNDERIEERVLQPSDWIRIGDYTLFFHVTPDGSIRMPARASSLEIGTAEPTRIGKLSDFEAPRISGRHLVTLMDLNRKLLSISAPPDRLLCLCQFMIGDDFHGSMALAARVEDDGSISTLAGPLRARALSAHEPPYISQGVLAKLRETGEPVLASNVGGRSTVDLTMSGHVLPLSVVACPLRRETGALELLYVMLPPGVGTAEWLSLISLATELYLQAEVAWQARGHAELHAAVERELQMARDIQRAVVPGDQAFPGLDVAIGFEPCRWVGGDYVDTVPMADGRILLTVADVCGKGLEAAMVASSLHTLVRATIEMGKSLRELILRLNAHLCRYLPDYSFVTMVMAAIDPATGALEVFNAGHPPALLVARDGEPRSLQSEAHLPLGIADLEPELRSYRLMPGEILLMYTDGLTELRSPERTMLGIEALHEGFAEICVTSPELGVVGLGRRLVQMLDEFRGGQVPEDDRAFLLARRRD